MESSRKRGLPPNLWTNKEKSSAFSVRGKFENREELTEEEIKEILGKLGFLKPIHERNLNFSSLYNLQKDSGVLVEKVYGVAGPALRYAPSRKTKVVLNSKFMDDQVSEISRLLRYITLNLLTLNIDWSDDICNNSRKEDEFYKHITPGFVDGRTRLKYDGYLNACLTNFFK